MVLEQVNKILHYALNFIDRSSRNEKIKMVDHQFMLQHLEDKFCPLLSFSFFEFYISIDSFILELRDFYYKISRHSEMEDRLIIRFLNKGQDAIYDKILENFFTQMQNLSNYALVIEYSISINDNRNLNLEIFEIRASLLALLRSSIYSSSQEFKPRISNICTNIQLAKLKMQSLLKRICFDKQEKQEVLAQKAIKLLRVNADGCNFATIIPLKFRSDNAYQAIIYITSYEELSTISEEVLQLISESQGQKITLRKSDKSANTISPCKEDQISEIFVRYNYMPTCLRKIISLEATRIIRSPLKTIPSHWNTIFPILHEEMTHSLYYFDGKKTAELYRSGSILTFSLNYSDNVFVNQRINSMLAFHKEENRISNYLYLCYGRQKTEYHINSQKANCQFLNIEHLQDRKIFIQHVKKIVHEFTAVIQQIANDQDIVEIGKLLISDRFIYDKVRKKISRYIHKQKDDRANDSSITTYHTFCFAIYLIILASIILEILQAKRNESKWLELGAYYKLFCEGFFIFCKNNKICSTEKLHLCFLTFFYNKKNELSKIKSQTKLYIKALDIFLYIYTNIGSNSKSNSSKNKICIPDLIEHKMPHFISEDGILERIVLHIKSLLFT